MGDRLLLRAKLHPLRVTSTDPNDHGFPGSLFLCPRLCWAAGLAELEQVEVVNLGNGARLFATVLVGGVGEASLPGGEVHGFDLGAQILVAANTRLSSQSLDRHTAAFVLVDHRRNAAIEIRDHRARVVHREPSCTPVAPFPLQPEPAATS